MTRSQRRASVAMFCIASVIYFLVNIQRVSVPGQIFDALQREFGLSASAVSSLGTAFMYAYAGAQLAVGLLADKYGGMRVLVSSSFLMVAGSLLFPLAHGYWMLLAGRILAGIGCSATYVCIVKENDRLFPDRFSSILGMIVLTGYLGAALGTMPLARLSSAYGWRRCFLAAGFCGALALLAIILLWKKGKQPPVSNEALSLRPYATGFSNRYNLIQLFSFTVNYGIYFCILSVFGKKLLTDAGGLGDGMASSINALMMILPALANEASGILTTCMGNRRRPFFVFLNTCPAISSALAIAALALDMPGKGPLLAVSCVIMSLVAGFTPVTSSLSRETNPPGSTGMAIGIINFGAYIMTAISGTACGAIMDCFGGTRDASGAVAYSHGSYIAIFAVFLLISILTFRISLMMPETHGKNIASRTSDK